MEALQHSARASAPPDSLRLKSQIHHQTSGQLLLCVPTIVRLATLVIR